MKLKCIVTGTGRCGTVYFAKLLTHLGVPCTHEAIFDYNGIQYARSVLRGEISAQLSEVSQRCEHALPDNNYFVAESSYMAVPFLKNDLIKDVPVIHLVRNPLHVISSFVNDGGYFKDQYPTNNYERFIYRHTSNMNKLETPILRAINFVVHWNRMITDACLNRKSIVVRIEDYDVGSICDFLEVPPPKKPIAISKTTNSWKRPETPMLTWLDIPNQGTNSDLLKRFAESNNYVAAAR